MPISSPLALASSKPPLVKAYPFASASPPAAAVSPDLVYEPVVQVRWPPENSAILRFGRRSAVLDSGQQRNISEWWSGSTARG
jgi:hypothetical protein